ncbi:E3 ubiquitin-protein ligase MIB2 isoform X1 [Octopus vulgaris]|uniref:E3 ubiquitin-protein ligase MIB2 isoform X1 n=1 Tax=Octopus vulgaris TaxID=6645 RepID=A0AA36C1X0_OCTVU|nr:E3 ubiquitin-protein ligase MIB2 isoform X1 [Octopus vulgaris]
MNPDLKEKFKSLFPSLCLFCEEKVSTLKCQSCGQMVICEECGTEPNSTCLECQQPTTRESGIGIFLGVETSELEIHDDSKDTVKQGYMVLHKWFKSCDPEKQTLKILGDALEEAECLDALKYKWLNLSKHETTENIDDKAEESHKRQGVSGTHRFMPENMFRRTIHLQNNSISTVEEGVFTGLSNLIDLYLDNNNISTIEEGVFTGLSNLIVFIFLGVDTTKLKIDDESIDTVKQGYLMLKEWFKNCDPETRTHATLRAALEEAECFAAMECLSLDAK